MSINNTLDLASAMMASILKVLPNHRDREGDVDINTAFGIMFALLLEQLYSDRTLRLEAFDIWANETRNYLRSKREGAL